MRLKSPLLFSFRHISGLDSVGPNHPSDMLSIPIQYKDNIPVTTIMLFSTWSLAYTSTFAVSFSFVTTLVLLADRNYSRSLWLLTIQKAAKDSNRSKKKFSAKISSCGSGGKMYDKINGDNDPTPSCTGGSQYIDPTWASDPRNPHNWSTVWYTKSQALLKPSEGCHILKLI